jgi:hypothetical protein
MVQSLQRSIALNQQTPYGQFIMARTPQLSSRKAAALREKLLAEQQQPMNLSPVGRLALLTISSGLAYIFSYSNLLEFLDAIHRHNTGAIKGPTQTVLLVSVFGGIIAAAAAFVFVDFLLRKRGRRVESISTSSTADED